MTLGSPPEVRHCDHAELAADLRARGEKVDALIVDCPYSERTHSGHDDGTAQANRVADWARAAAARGVTTVRGGVACATRVAHATREGGSRRTISYAPWTPADVAAFVAAWAPLTTGWIVSLTDHVLAPAWALALDDAGRYVFSPLACVEPGSRIRLTGDGPAQWSTWAVVSRPRDGAWLAEWRGRCQRDDVPTALPGAYVVGLGEGDTRAGRRSGLRLPGGKPLSLMRAIVRDYSRPGDLVCDPCCGAATTLVAAKLEGRRAIGCDRDAKHVDIARRWLAGLPPRSETQPGLFDELHDDAQKGAAE